MCELVHCIGVHLEFLLLGELLWHLWDKCRDQYNWDEQEEMQGDAILGQSTRLNFRISCMTAPMAWRGRSASTQEEYHDL